MKFTLSLLSLCLFMTLSSCSKDKDDDAGSGQIKCKIDGVNKEFNFMASAVRSNLGGTYSVSIFGFSGGSQSDQISIAVGNDAEVSSGEYTWDGTGPTSTKVAVLTLNAQESDDEVYTSSYFEDESVVVTITSIDANSVKGTFRGKISSGSFSSSDTKTVTEGSFNVKF